MAADGVRSGLVLFPFDLRCEIISIGMLLWIGSWWRDGEVVGLVVSTSAVMVVCMVCLRSAVHQVSPIRM